MASSSTKYLRTTIRTELSRSNDYSNPIDDTSVIVEDTPTRCLINHEFLAATGGTTIDLSPFGTVTQVIIRNRDTTNYVDVTYRTAAGGATDQNNRVYDHTPVTLGHGVTVASDLVFTANTADCECVVTVFGTV